MIFAEIEKKKHFALPLLLNSLCDGAVQRPIHRPTGAEFHQFLWVTQGDGVFRVGGTYFLLSLGDGIFTRAGIPHSYEGECLQTAWCTFLLPNETLDYLGVGDYLPFKTPSFLDRETRQLLRIANGDSTPLSRSSATYSYITELFTAILSENESVSVRARRLLEQKYADPLTLPDIAEELRLNRFSLCRLYKQEQGVTLMEDLNRIRIKKAKQLLKYSTDPVETVGRLCGFESLSYFGKRFREAVGCTPTEYRKTHPSSM